MVRHVFLELNLTVYRGGDIALGTVEGCNVENVGSSVLAVFESVSDVSGSTAGASALALHVIAAHNQGAVLVVEIYVVGLVRVCEDHVGA